MPSIKIFKNIKIIKYVIVGIKLQRFCCYMYHKCEKFQAKVPCLFALRAVHAYKHLSPSRAVQEDIVPVACISVYGAKSYRLSDQNKVGQGMWLAWEKRAIHTKC
jgi:hypothetical protein